jgi:hypothetical protein
LVHSGLDSFVESALSFSARSPLTQDVDRRKKNNQQTDYQINQGFEHISPNRHLDR